MTQVNFYDDTNEILVGNAVDLVIDEKSPQQFLYDSLEGYGELTQLLNDIVVIMPVDSKEQGESFLKNYNTVARDHIQSNLRDYLLNKLELKKDKIVIPLKLYVAFIIRGNLRLHLDTLGYSANLNSKTAEEDFTAKHNDALYNYSKLFTSIICKASYEKHYYFPKHIFSVLKKMFGELEGYHSHYMPLDSQSALLRELLQGIETIQNDEEFISMGYPGGYLKKVSDVCKIVTERREGQHYTLDYIIFCSLFLNNPPLIVISKDCGNVEVGIGYEILLTNSDSLITRFVNTEANFLLVNPFRGLGDLIQRTSTKESKDILQMGREKYAELWETKAPLDEKMNKLVAYIVSQLNKYDKVEFNITTKHQQPDCITSIVTQLDSKKFHDTKTSFDSPPEIEIKPLPKGKEKRIYKAKKKLKDI